MKNRKFAIIFPSLILILFVFCGDLSSQLQIITVAIRSSHNGKYVCAGFSKDTLLAANSGDIKGWEKFIIVPLADESFALRSAQNGKFVSVGTDQNALLVATSSKITNRAIFEMVRLNPTEFAFKSTYNDKYVRVGIGQNTLLGATSSDIKAWEKFQLLHIRKYESETIKMIVEAKNDAVDSVMKMMETQRRALKRLMNSTHNQ